MVPTKRKSNFQNIFELTTIKMAVKHQSAAANNNIAVVFQYVVMTMICS